MLKDFCTKSSTREKILFLLFFLACGAFLFWRAPFGYSYYDEPYCVALAQRFYKGDALIADEWNAGQNIGVLLLPLYSLFYGITGSTDGILLTFRYVYCALWLCTCAAVYICLREYKWGAAAAAVYLVLFSPLDNMTLSYTSVSFMCILLLACMSWGSCWKRHRPPFRTGLAMGFLLTVAVLCDPYIAIFFVLFWLVLITAAFFRKKMKKSRESYDYTLRLALGMTVTAAVCLVCYLIFMFSRASLEEIIKNFPMMFLQPQHDSRTSFKGTPWYILRDMFRRTPVLLILVTVLGLAAIFWKKTPKYRLWFFIPAALVWAYYAFTVDVYSTADMNYQMKDIAVLGILAFLLLEKRPWPLALIFYGFSAIYTYVFYIASNQGLISASMGLAVAGAAALVFIWLLLKELREQYRDRKPLRYAAVIVAALVLLAQPAAELRVRLQRTYWEHPPLSNLDTRIDFGSNTGIYTSAENYEKYRKIYDAQHYFLDGEDTEGKSFMSYIGVQSVYLDADMDYGTFSAWSLFYGDKFDDFQKMYFELNSKPTPDYIFFFDYEGRPMPDISNVPGYRAEYTDGAAMLYKEQ